MAQREFLVTQEGLAKLEAELNELKSVRRQEVADKIKRAREMGGTENNAEYEDAKNEQSFVEGRILELENMLKQAKIIESPRKTNRVSLGSTVRLIDQDGRPWEYTIVGRAEADPINNKISNESPVGKALLGAKVGQVVEVAVPAGLLKLKVMEIL
ncbi:MAG: transcription elongation factor GreA [Dehalococcoidia bacterium]|nr:transcription elongation factor GreA [Dehalococcoidia bacterium]